MLPFNLKYFNLRISQILLFLFLGASCKVDCPVIDPFEEIQRNLQGTWYTSKITTSQQVTVSFEANCDWHNFGFGFDTTMKTNSKVITLNNLVFNNSEINLKYIPIVGDCSSFTLIASSYQLTSQKGFLGFIDLATPNEFDYWIDTVGPKSTILKTLYPHDGMIDTVTYYLSRY